jgi:hypothetical protein
LRRFAPGSPINPPPWLGQRLIGHEPVAQAFGTANVSAKVKIECRRFEVAAFGAVRFENRRYRRAQGQRKEHFE